MKNGFKFHEKWSRKLSKIMKSDALGASGGLWCTSWSQERFLEAKAS